MKTLIINGSPKGKHGNTELFINRFNGGQSTPCPVRYMVKEDPKQLAQDLQDYDTVLVAMPLYIHAMPSIVMELFEQMTPAATEGKALGFIVQLGFVESAQAQYLERYLRLFSERLNYRYLGTVIKGNSAGVYMMPEKMTKGLFTLLGKLGAGYEQTGGFDPAIVQELGKPYRLSKAFSGFMEFLYRIGVGNLFWHSMLRQNGALAQKKAQPYAGD